MRRQLHRDLDLDIIFPIKDEPSAWLMSFKADCLYGAGVITERERQAVQTVAAKVASVRCQQAA